MLGLGRRCCERWFSACRLALLLFRSAWFAAACTCACVCVCLLPSGAVAQYTVGSQQLLVNGGCESGASTGTGTPESWSVAGGGSNAWRCTDSSRFAAPFGTYSFFCGPGTGPTNLWTAIEQTVAVPPGAVGMRLGGQFRGNAYNDDIGRANLTALTSSDADVGFKNDTGQLLSGGWISFELFLGPFPPGVGKVRLALDGLWVAGGSNCDAFFDGLELRPLFLTTTGATTAATTAATTTDMIAATTTDTTTATTTPPLSLSAGTTSAGSSSMISTALVTFSSTSGVALSTISSTSTIPDVADNRESPPAPDFPWWIVAIAAATFCCCMIACVFLVYRRKRNHKHRPSKDANEEMLGIRGETSGHSDSEGEYDRITHLRDDSQKHDSRYVNVKDLTALAESHYAKIPSAAAVHDGNYAKIPQFQGFSDIVTSVNPQAVFVDMSRKVGKGSAGDVYRGQYQSQDVAVKLLKDEFTEDALKTFYQEIETISRIPPHEHLVGFVGACPAPVLILTEFCGQGSLSRFLRRSDLKQPQMLKTMRDIASGMRHLSANRILHRDLAARNVLLTNNLEVKITDFGLSVQTEGDAHHSKSTTGPVRWMAVETIKRGIYSEKSDVWSYAVTCWEVLNRGATPYGNKIPTIEAARKVIKGHRLEFLDNIPESIQNCLTVCMHENPAARPTFAEIVAVFEQTDGETIIYADLSTFAHPGEANTNNGTDIADLRDQ